MGLTIQTPFSGAGEVLALFEPKNTWWIKQPPRGAHPGRAHRARARSRLATATDRPALGPIVEELVLAADQATLMTRRLLSLSRKTPTPPEDLEVGEVFHQFSPLLRRLLPPSVTLRLSVEEPLRLKVSRSGLELILLNLVVNARDAMPRGGVIDVKVAAGSVTVMDCGVGIAPEAMPLLFTPFFTTKAEGTGLGLANVAELSAAMNAKVEVHSTLGQGATFALRFGAGAS